MKGLPGNRNTKLNILFLSQRFLFPLDTGGKIRTANLLKHLCKTNRITLISNVESPKNDPYLCEVNHICDRFVSVPFKKVPRYSTFFWIKLLLNMFSIFPVSVLNDYSKKLKNVVEREYNEKKFDLLICDFVQSALLFNGLDKVPSILFQHNVESLIMKRHALNAKNPISRLFWWLQYIKMNRYENISCKSFNKVIAVSANDKEYFKTFYDLDNVEIIPTGVDLDLFKPLSNYKQNPNSIVFCGSMDWLPNEDAMRYFIKAILPLIKERVPNIELTIVGKKPPHSIQKLAHQFNNVKLTGWVKDVRPYIAKGTIVIVPLRIGGGTRLKIFEAMAMGKAVVSTSIGAEGLPLVDGQHIIIADKPVTMANKIIQLLSSEELRRKIAQNACFYVRENFAWLRVAEKFNKICNDTARRNDDII